MRNARVAAHEAEGLAGGEALRSEFAERPAAPERESFPKPAQRIFRRQLPRRADELLEPLEVELAGTRNPYPGARV
jgi:hypothetical protein